MLLRVVFSLANLLCVTAAERLVRCADLAALRPAANFGGCHDEASSGLPTLAAKSVENCTLLERKYLETSDTVLFCADLEETLMYRLGDSLSWTECSAACHSMGGMPAELRSFAEMSAFASLAAWGGGAASLGFSDACQRGLWKWASDGALVSSLMWQRNEPPCSEDARCGAAEWRQDGGRVSLGLRAVRCDAHLALKPICSIAKTHT